MRPGFQELTTTLENEAQFYKEYTAHDASYQVAHRQIIQRWAARLWSYPITPGEATKVRDYFDKRYSAEPVEATTSTSNTTKDNSVSTPYFEIKAFLNGDDIATILPAVLVQRIKEKEAKIAELKSLSTPVKVVTEEIARHEAELKALVDYLNK
jgi:hypothetical protein